jgi:TPR repeat protein
VAKWAAPVIASWLFTRGLDEGYAAGATWVENQRTEQYYRDAEQYYRNEDYGKAREWYHKAAAMGHVEAQFQLMVLYLWLIP